MTTTKQNPKQDPQKKKQSISIPIALFFGDDEVLTLSSLVLVI